MCNYLFPSWTIFLYFFIVDNFQLPMHHDIAAYTCKYTTTLHGTHAKTPRRIMYELIVDTVVDMTVVHVIKI